MSLRDDFEKLFGPEPGEDEPHSDEVAHLIWASQLEGYQAATERAVRIAEEELAARPKYFRVVEAIDKILKRLKDES